LTFKKVWLNLWASNVAVASADEIHLIRGDILKRHASKSAYFSKQPELLQQDRNIKQEQNYVTSVIIISHYLAYINLQHDVRHRMGVIRHRTVPYDAMRHCVALHCGAGFSMNTSTVLMWLPIDDLELE